MSDPIRRPDSLPEFARPPLDEAAPEVQFQETCPAWRERIIGRLEEIVRLERGWDGYQGCPVSPENANFTLNMLYTICGNDAPPPQIAPGAGGDLQVEWHTLAGDIELHVRAPYDVHAWRAMAGGDVDGEEVELTNDFSIVAKWIEQMMEPPRDVASAAA